MKKIISIAALAALLGGCMPSRDHLTANVVSPEPDWIKYLENDGSVGNIAFFSENLSKTYALKDGDVIGMAIVKRADMALKLGDMYALNGLSFTALELDDKEKFGYRYVNMRDKAEHEALKKVKTVKSLKY